MAWMNRSKAHYMLMLSKLYTVDVEVDGFLPCSMLRIFMECNLQGKRGVWIKLPIQHANLVEAAVKVNMYWDISFSKA